MQSNETYTATQARENFSEIISKAIYRGPVLIKRNEKVTAAVISYELLNLITQLEAIMDSEKARKALAEYETQGGISLDKLKRELGM